VDIVIDQICDQLKRAWQNGGRPTIESFLDNAPTADRNGLLYELLRLETALRQADGDPPDLSDYLRRFPSDASVIQSAFDDGVSGNKSTGRKSDPLDVTTDHSSDSPVDPSGLTATMASTDPPGETIGRYRTKLLLGEGAFGSVWLGYDEELRRSVAIKVPKPERFRGPQDAEAYLAEARTVASLDHPHIVPVYDVGRTAEGSIYVVSKYIEGCTLADRIGSDRMPLDEITKLLTTSAQALHHAHGLRLIHRDIKPANILVEERTGTYYVADFGLAIREEDHLRDGRIAGTPAYMSPEQVRGEGHRLDGRSDVFALGVMMYELLTGKRPFRGSTANEIYHQIISVDPQPPRSLESDIPEELQRICLKALAKRAADRYATAAELADDLSNWQQGPATLATERTIIPKGLRSFDADDADFFLDLLPGPRDRSGLPASLRFWKTRIEARESEQTFNVGLIYGPSGCGKSSLVKAGLIPRLSKDVIPLYIEATPDETETRILRALQKHVSDLPANTSLAETFAILRRRNVSGMALATGSPAPKIVIIVDQFEQWLHAHRGEADAELVAAFRQCDGAQVQAIVMVRDDFAMAAARFMDMIEVPIVQGKNFTTVDLFDIDHAEQVFTKFGRAFGKLPAAPTPLADHEQAFVSAVVGGLADEGQVVSVRLSLFAEMVKSKPWTMQTLLDVGGTDGIGVNFLEETFSSRNANPTHRLHEQAARAVLRSLLPDVTTDIKGHMRSHAELLADSGYESRPAEFNALLRILDGELRLISPTDPEGTRDSSRSSSVDTRYFQLTHDYMVPSLREWLTRKQQETRVGRAELKLAERTNLWTAKPENRYLPSLVEWFSIRTLTDRKRWTSPQQSLMQRATRVHGSRIAMGLAASVLLLVGGLWTKARVDEEQARTSAHGLVAALLSAETRDVSKLVTELTPYRQWADPELQSALESPDIKTQLHARIALLPVDASQVEPLQNALLDTTPENVLVLREVLHAHGDKIAESYWAILQSTDATNQQRLSAGSALAKFTPDDERWDEVAGPVSNLLVNENLLWMSVWIDAFRPVRLPLIPELGKIFRDQSDSVTPTQRELATNFLEMYAANDVNELAALILDAQPEQFAALFDEFKAHGTVAKEKLVEVIDRRPSRPAMWEAGDVPSLEEHPVLNADRALIKAADGMLTDDFAFVQTISRTDFDKLATSLAVSGYRPTKIRPSWIGESLNVAAVWHRDGRKSTYRFDLTPEALSEFDKSARDNAMIPADIAGYIDRTTSPPVEHYVGLWEPLTAETSNREFFVGQSIDEYMTGNYANEGNHMFRGQNDNLVFSGIYRRGRAASGYPQRYPIANFERSNINHTRPQYQIQVYGQTPYRTNDEAKIISEISEHLTNQPNDWFQLLRRANAYAKLGDRASALLDVDAVVALQSKCVPALRERFLCQIALKNGDKANADFDQLKSLSIGDWERRFFEQLLSDQPDYATLSDPISETHIDLLHCVDVSRHSASGTWSRIDGVIESPRGVAKLNVPVVPQSPYRLNLLVSPSVPPEGNQNVGLILGLIVGDKRFYLEFGDAFGAFIELEGKKKIASKTRFGLKPGTIYAIEVAVADGAVNVSLDGDTIIEWSGANTELATKPFWETPEFGLTFCAYEANYRFLNAVLEIEGDAKCNLLASNAAQENRMLEGSLWAECAGQNTLAEKLAATYFDSIVKQRGNLSTDVGRPEVMRAYARLKPPIDPNVARALVRIEVGWSDARGLDSRLTKPSSPSDHAVACLAFANEGYVPVAIDVTSVAGSTFASSVWHRKVITTDSINQLERLKANAVTALARSNDREKLFAGLRVTDNPEALTQFIHRCRDSGITASELLELLNQTDQTRQLLNSEPRKTEDRVLFGLLLALGEFRLIDVPELDRPNLLDKVADWFANDPSSAIHGATGWLLRQWGRTDIVQRVDQTPLPYDSGREWFTIAIDAHNKRFYQTYIVIPPGEYDIGSPVDERGRRDTELRSRVRLTRPLAILDREVTRGEFETSGLKQLFYTEYSPTTEHPMVAISWTDSVQFCRWLTGQAGLEEADQAYPDPKALSGTNFANVADGGFPENWPVDLAKVGFRLPTEAEWEIACRGGINSMYGFGADDRMLDQYAWYHDNSDRQTHVAKEKRPNLRGLFDMHGNAYEWCHDLIASYQLNSIMVDPKGGQGGSSRVMRGGGWDVDTVDCRAANRSTFDRALRHSTIGFRLAFTLDESVQSVADSAIVDAGKQP
jgi:serine/threonine protein kinase/formylglycine-generating enzyme required for sulfatase activity